MQFVTENVCKSPLQSLKCIWVMYFVLLLPSHSTFSAGISNGESGGCHLKMRQAPPADTANAKWLFSSASSRYTHTEKLPAPTFPFCT